MSVTFQQLHEPVTDEDMDDLIDYATSLADTTKAYFDRVRFQQQGDSHVSNELWCAYCELTNVEKRLRHLKEQVAFPKEQP